MPRSADDFERLAIAFRPSWELDDAPFAGAGMLTAQDIRDLQGRSPTAEAGAPKEQLATLAATPEPAMAAPTPEPLAPPASVEPQPNPPRAHASTQPTVLPARSRAPSLADSSASFVQPSKKPLWIGAAAVAVVLAGASVWAMSGDHAKPAPAMEATATPVQNTNVHAIPPPPPETAVPPPTAVAPPPATAVALPPAPVASATFAAPPVAPPAAAPPPAVVAHAAPAAQPAPRPAYTPPARPAARKGPTIVRDVPF